MSERYKPQDPPAHLVAECIALDPEAAPAGLRWRERPRWHFATAAAWAQWNGRFGGQPIAGSINNRGEFRLGLRLCGRQYSLPTRRVAAVLRTETWPKAMRRARRSRP